MSRLFGPARQSGFVVDDLDAALEYWTRTLGIGPFFRVDHLGIEKYSYGGQLSEIDLSVALANFGDMQIELIYQHNDAPSTYRTFLREQGPGLHHMAVWVQDYEATIRAALDEGRPVECDGVILDGPAFTYFASGRPGLPLLEVVEQAPSVMAYFAEIRQAAENWDGADPVRLPAQA